MIEIKYNEGGQAVLPEQAAVRIPKNIRQVGDVQGSRKIYVEDYVITYLRQLSKKEEGIPQVAVLLGHTGQADGIHYTFASGAVETARIEVDYDGIQFTDEAWTDIYEKIKQYFDSLEIVGWILMAPELSATINADIVKAHMKNFQGEDKFFMMMDPAEREETFYICENGDLIRQRGYYIYFEKNAVMQEYMISRNENTSIEVTEKISDRAAVDFRRIVNDREEDRHQKKMMTFMYAVSSFLVMIVLVIGITMVNNYDKMKIMEESLQVISRSVNGGQADSDMSKSTDIPVESVPADVEPDDDKDTEPQGQDDSNADTDTPTDIPDTYTVAKGDTLAAIAMKIYGDKSKVEDICELNQIDNGDKIMVGQVLRLP